MRRTIAHVAVVLGVMLIGAASGSQGWGAPLGKEACDALQAEHAGLEAAGLPETIRKGAAWGRANLTPEKLKQVERFIGVREQLLFRCGLAKLKVLPGADGEETGDADKPAADKSATVGEASGAPPAKPKPKPKAKPKVAEPVAASGADAPEAATVKAKPKPKPKPKPKVDDAYRPPVPKE